MYTPALGTQLLIFFLYICQPRCKVPTMQKVILTIALAFA
jgi:hypothetical protein